MQQTREHVPTCRAKSGWNEPNNLHCFICLYNVIAHTHYQWARISISPKWSSAFQNLKKWDQKSIWLGLGYMRENESLEQEIELELTWRAEFWTGVYSWPSWEARRWPCFYECGDWSQGEVMTEQLKSEWGSEPANEWQGRGGSLTQSISPAPASSCVNSSAPALHNFSPVSH